MFVGEGAVSWIVYDTATDTGIVHLSIKEMFISSQSLVFPFRVTKLIDHYRYFQKLWTVIFEKVIEKL